MSTDLLTQKAEITKALKNMHNQTVYSKEFAKMKKTLEPFCDYLYSHQILIEIIIDELNQYSKSLRRLAIRYYGYFRCKIKEDGTEIFARRTETLLGNKLFKKPDGNPIDLIVQYEYQYLIKLLKDADEKTLRLCSS